MCFIACSFLCAYLYCSDFLEPDAPSLFVLNPSSNSVDIHWNHSITVDCYKRCYFSFDVQLYEMNSKDPIDSKSLLGLSIRFSFLDVNKSYTAEIKSLCVLNGMNIFSKPLQVNFLTKGTSVCVCILGHCF